ncbi:MAG: MlaD family protein [Magnetospirillum sp. WYHS-4]
MRSKDREIREVLVGGLAVLGLVAMLGLSYGGGKDAAKTQAGEYALKAIFNRVDGLLEGDEVHLGGIRVGTVDRLSLDANFRAVATLRIRSSVKLPRDTSAAVHTDGLFGSKFVVLEPGGEEENFKPGATIDFTQDAVIVGELLDLIIAEGRANRKN